jgi:type VI protein secretion system component VasK
MLDTFGWNSLETVSTIQSTARIIGITLLGLLVIAETIDFVYDRREHTLIEIGERIAETRRQHEQHDAEARHAAEVAELREQATQAEQTLKRLQQDREPRSLTPEQQTELTHSMVLFEARNSRRRQ